jgi:hypothetical protein
VAETGGPVMAEEALDTMEALLHGLVLGFVLSDFLFTLDMPVSLVFDNFEE